jgi:tetratricopeptide (TPR) repeat protein
MTARLTFLFVLVLSAAWLATGQAPRSAPPKPASTSVEERLARHRNLGKAFYENPTTQAQAVAEFKSALDLAPNSTREQLNYGLALLRAGKTADGIAVLEAVEKKDPKLPHPYFNLAIEFKKQGENEKALTQIREFVKLAPTEPMGHYNLGVLLKAQGQSAQAIPAFEQAAKLDLNLAAARFQLFNAYRTAGRQPEAQAMLAEFQKLKKEQEGSATPEDVDWCAYSEILDAAPPPLAPRVPEKFEDTIVATGAPGVALANGVIHPLHADSGDFDNDGSIDLAVVDNKGVSIVSKGKTVQTFAGSYNDAVWIDYDHDYDLDLVLLGAQSKLMRNQGPQGFVDRTADFPFLAGEATLGVVKRTVPDTRGIDLLVSYKGRGPVLYRDLLGGKWRAEDWKGTVEKPRLVADFDRDGREDFVFRDAEGRVHKMLNRTLPRANWVRIKLTGVKNLRTAPFAEVEIKAGALYEKKVYRGEPLVFDLRNMTVIDTVRITWPNGLIQNEPNQAANREYDYKEAQRLSGSCPIIWTWDGTCFRYITDVLGVAPLGAAAGDGKYFDTDHDEYVAIPGEALRARDGNLEVRITEELSEVAYLDRVALIAVDHPADTAVYHNDKWKSPPYPEFRLWGVKQRIRPLRMGNPKAFRRDLRGIAEMHALDIQFPAAAPKKGALVLHGWVDWADGSTFLAAAQESAEGLVPPVLEAKNERGDWVVIDADMGMPAGKPKTIVVPFEFPSSRRELRIRTNLCVYWEDVFLTPDLEAPEAVLTTLDAVSADLRFRGFSPNQVHPLRLEPEKFFYDGATPTSLWNPTPGFYTRYGDVAGLLASVDDRMTVMGSGDEIRLLFPETKLPALKPGWRRDYLLLVDGWAKDRDANTAHGQTVGPLPFHRMSQYPFTQPGEQHPDPEYQKNTITRPALRLIRSLAGD